MRCADHQRMPLPPRSPFRAPWSCAWTWVPPLVLVLVLACLFCTDLFNQYARWGSYPLFLDSHAILAAVEGDQAGVDVFHPHFYDPLCRPHVYPSLWLQLKHLGLTRASLVPFSLGCIALLVVPLLLTLRASTWREAFWLSLFFVSSPLLLTLHRANNDLVVFGLMAGALYALQAPNRLMRLFAPLCIALAAGLKIYPVICLLVVLAEEDARWRLRLLLLGLLACSLIALQTVPDYFRIATYLPSPSGETVFGMMDALRISGVPPKMATILALLLGAVVASVGFTAGLRTQKPLVGLTPLHDWKYRLLLMAGTLLGGAYWSGCSYLYRLIFVIGWLPILLTPAPVGSAPGWYRHARLVLLSAIGFTLIEHHLLIPAIALGSDTDTLITLATIKLRFQWLAHAVIGVVSTLVVAELVGYRVAEIWRQRTGRRGA